MIESGARAFLFLQGPPGPFFAQLAAALRALGRRCCRVNFNGGDWLDWPEPAIDFTGTLADWPDVLDGVLRREGITDIVLFGDCRPLHRVAAAAASALGIAVHVFEEGYIRPDWITLERGGVNGYSSLPKHHDTYLALAAGLPPMPALPPVPASFSQRAREAFRYYLASWALAARFPGYASHRPHSVPAEFRGWAWRMLKRPVARWRSARVLARLQPRTYFILPLQLDSDHQIRTHSPFSSMTDALNFVLWSFGTHAPRDATLLIKEHPLDNGLQPWRAMVARLADEHGVSRRVRFVAHGDLEALVVESRGVVTVNSTSGTLALASGTPVIVLGKAVYDLPGITHRGDLASFWAAPAKPQVEIFEAFRRVLACRCLLRGGFSSRAGRAELVPRAAGRLNASHSLERHGGSAPCRQTA